jgi:hypothetical protein
VKEEQRVVKKKARMAEAVKKKAKKENEVAASNLAARTGVTRLVKTGKWKVSCCYIQNSKHLGNLMTTGALLRSATDTRV